MRSDIGLDAGHGGEQYASMKRPVRCFVGMHRWKKAWHHERAAFFKECTACGKRMGTGWPSHLGAGGI